MTRANSNAIQQTWANEGYFISRQLFTPPEISSLRDHFMKLHHDALEPNSVMRERYAPRPLEECDNDLLKHYPRVMQPHRYDAMSLRYLLDRRVREVLKVLFDESPLAAQSMFYFKPPGARGQALHQDNFYLRVQPGTCIAAWTAVDDTNSQNGSLFVVPGSQHCDVLCPHPADLTRSFSTEEVDVPEGLAPIEIKMQAGDVLFFNGSLIHGSYPNTTTDRFRRAFICHYVPQSTAAMSGSYYPLHDFDGNQYTRANAEGGGPCGTEEDALLETTRHLRDVP